MTLTNFDASQLSLRKRNKALASWKVFNDTLVNSGSSILQEQPSFQTSQVISQRNLGKVSCGCIPSSDGLDASVSTYQFNGLSSAVQVNF